MVRTILKFVVSVRQPRGQMPAGARIVAVGWQPSMLQDQVGIWAECEVKDLDADSIRSTEHEVREFEIYGTCHPIAPNRDYVGTAHAGHFVWHLYERKADG